MSTFTLLTAIIALVILALLLFMYERTAPKAREILPVVIICVIASLGRIIFSFLPSIQPVTAIVIIMGVCFGKKTGFITGCLCALISNIYLGHGPWTPWQMLAWGLIGIIAALITNRKTNQINQINKKTFIIVTLFSFFSAFIYSILIDIWTISTLYEGLTKEFILTIFSTGIIFNIPHAIGNVVFIILLYKPLTKILIRLKNK